jgi:acetylornithine deacetylase/succinyl-diaminopimelate desuccinylase-like protein
MPLDPVETLQKLIQTPSVNPMGRSLSGSPYGESRMTELLVGICREQGWPWLRQPVHPERDNLVVYFEGNPSPQGGGELLLWDVHQDTVGVEGMTVDPFGGEVRDGRVYGRGASDVKGSMAAMLAALSRLDPRSTARRPSILLACTANEECGFTGARELAARFAATRAPRNVVYGARASDQDESRFFAAAPNAAIVAEPTEFNVIVAHQGQVRWRCHTVGRAAHTSRPDMGINAIYAMSQVVQAIEQYHKRLATTGIEHPLCGRPSVCVSTITGGVGVNTVPERAMIEIDRRLAPAEEPTAAYGELIDYIAVNADIGQCRIEHDAPFMQSRGLSDADNRSFASQLAKLVQKHGRPGEVCGAPYGTDAAAYSAIGIPTVVFGPGSIDQAHTADEFIEIDELQLAADVFYDIACRGIHL